MSIYNDKFDDLLKVSCHDGKLDWSKGVSNKLLFEESLGETHSFEGVIEEDVNGVSDVGHYSREFASPDVESYDQGIVVWFIEIDSFVFVKGYFMVGTGDGFSNYDIIFGFSLVSLDWVD